MDGHTRLTLLFARLLITDPDCWAAGVLARDPNGRPVSPLEETAKSWCARGAVYRVVGGDIRAYWRAIRVLERSSRALYGARIRSVNDGPSAFAHGSVLGAFDHAVDALGLARQAHELATRPPQERMDVLQLLGLSSRSTGRRVDVQLVDANPATGAEQPFTEDEHVAPVSSHA